MTYNSAANNSMINIRSPSLSSMYFCFISDSVLVCKYQGRVLFLPSVVGKIDSVQLFHVSRIIASVADCTCIFLAI